MAKKSRRDWLKNKTMKIQRRKKRQQREHKGSRQNTQRND